MIDSIEFSRRLYFAIDGFNLVLRRITPCYEVIYDLTLKKAEIRKNRKPINDFDFSHCKNIKEWGEQEHELFNYLGDLVLEIAQERTQKDSAEGIEEEVPF